MEEPELTPEQTLARAMFTEERNRVAKNQLEALDHMVMLYHRRYRYCLIVSDSKTNKPLFLLEQTREIQSA